MGFYQYVKTLLVTPMTALKKNALISTVTHAKIQSALQTSHRIQPAKPTNSKCKKRSRWPLYTQRHNCGAIKDTLGGMMNLALDGKMKGKFRGIAKWTLSDR